MLFFTTLFFLSFVGELWMPFLFPSIRILGFLPFILFGLSRLSLPRALWCSATAGLMVDLYASGPPLGFFALNYTLTTLILYRYRKFFSEEKLFSFALYGVVFSALSTLIHFFLYAIIDTHLKLSFLTLLTDLICMPIVDGIYTLVWALFPVLLYKYLEKSLIFRKWFHELSRIAGK